MCCYFGKLLALAKMNYSLKIAPKCLVYRELYPENHFRYLSCLKSDVCVNQS